MPRFHSFAIIAEMRTGSNLLEATLASLSGVRCHGELFNQAFVGRPGKKAALGISSLEREADPGALLNAVAKEEGLSGFRYFHDHDPRVPALLLADPGCALIRLTRSPVDCYISRKIAQATGQWRLSDLGDRKTAKAWFDRVDFEEYLHVRDCFDRDFRRAMQTSGRVAYKIAYHQLGDLEVLNGLARWLGIEARLTALPTGFRKQNPGSLSERVENHAQMAAVIEELGLASSEEDAAFRQLPGPGVPRYLTAARSGLLFQPLPGGPVGQVTDWLERLDGAAPRSGYRQKTLKAWQSEHPGHRAFTVLRHPALRAFHVFRDFVVPGRVPGLPAQLLARYGVELPPADLASGFTNWLKFLAGNLAGQTSVRADPLWIPQTELLSGIAAFRPPDLILREEELSRALPELARSLGGQAPAIAKHEGLDEGLAAIVTPKIERLVARVYRRDFATFGFGDWRSGGL